MKIVATRQASATNADALQILEDRAARLQGEGARPRKLREADATADRALKALEALPGSKYDAAAIAAKALSESDLGLTRNERLAILNCAPTNSAVASAVVNNDAREPPLDGAQVAAICDVGKKLRK
jgi:phage-related minor tail protein